MTNPNDTVHAWQHHDNNGQHGEETGLTKREYFAAIAMQGLRAAKLLRDAGNNGDLVNPGWPAKLWTSKDVAKLAIADADALIAALNATNDSKMSQ